MPMPRNLDGHGHPAGRGAPGSGCPQPRRPHTGFLTRQVFLEYYPHGVIGADPRRASAELGERALAAAVAAYEKVLRGWASEP